MTLSVAIQMDPISDIDIDADSTFALAMEAQIRGHRLHYYMVHDMSLRGGRVIAWCRDLELRREQERWQKKLNKTIWRSKVY